MLRLGSETLKEPKQENTVTRASTTDAVVERTVRLESQLVLLTQGRNITRKEQDPWQIK